MAIDNLANYVGKIVVFVGATTSDATAGNLEAVRSLAVRARAAGVDSLCIRRGNGTMPIADHAELVAERDACHEAGIGWIPYLYSYGPRFGDVQIAGETALLAALGSVNGVVVADMEQEWDGQYRAAQYFERLMRPVPCDLIVTSWANPISHNWPVAAIAPCVNAWCPQDYNNWLVAQTWQQIRTGETVRFPAYDMTQEFGANNTAADAIRTPSDTVWLWELDQVLANPGVIQQIRQGKGW